MTTMEKQRHIVIVGAGQAGYSVATSLRRKGFGGRISLFGNEDLPPYQRPALSKAFLLGKIDRERLLLKPATSYAEEQVALVLGETVEALHPARREIIVSGEVVTYDDLVLATGAEPRRLPDVDANALHVLRGFADAERLGAALHPGRRLLIIGGGYIGLETAAVARAKGLDVTVLEAAPRILQRVAAPETSDYFRALHVERGVTIIEGVSMKSLTVADEVRTVTLSDGRRLDADIVVLGIGVSPRTELAERAGITVDNGIVVDAQGRTSEPNVWAVGDCCSFPYQGRRIRLESVPNAIDQAGVVAGALLGTDERYEAQPWFWSDQYEVKLQTAGLNIGYDRTIVATRSGDRRSCAVWYFRGATAIAVDAINDARTYMAARRAFQQDKAPTYDEIARATVESNSESAG
ncbi:NAD(P)/FAD-dependent oxidoreductase [Chelatococcus asaccharovorans]|uniref:NAD(P)/FAD-dependent oxidoreductase n=1 Tax=Chelatococcus asaccharovorans TaxID=28210 RepID=UPI002264FB79|nr:FAD-dependent oxidoreductase [Chelatococcus asaccharovorans]